MNSQLYQMKPVREADREALLSLLITVFHGEQGIPESSVVAIDQEETRWWGAYIGETLIGTACAWKEQEEYHWGRFCIHPDYRGQKIAGKLAEKSLHDLFASGKEVLVSEARDTTVHILKKMGAEITGPPVFFYGSNVTPMKICRENFHHYQSAGNHQ